MARGYRSDMTKGVSEAWPWYLADASYLDQYRLLWQYERWRCVWRPGIDGLWRLLPLMFAIVGAVASAYIVDLSRPATVVLGACVAIGLDRLGAAWRRRHDIQLLVPRRLWAWENSEVGGDTEIPLLINNADVDRTTHILRASQLSPGGSTRVPVPPNDAPWGDVRMIVRLPLASKNHEPLKDQVKHSLRAQNIRGRVGGEEIVES